MCFRGGNEKDLDALKGLNSVKFAYKKEMKEKHVEFIEEEVPELIATKEKERTKSEGHRGGADNGGPGAAEACTMANNFFPQRAVE